MSASSRTPLAHRWLDTASGGLLLAMTVWAPWGFGCADAWTMRFLVWGGYGLGFMLLAKQMFRWRFAYRPERWARPSAAGRWVVRGMAAATVLFLLWVAVGVWNAHGTVEFTRAGPLIQARDREVISWLPTTYDLPNSQAALWRWTALALAFWAARDWLLGKSRSERHHEVDCPFPPQRLRWLLWTLALSGGMLAIVGILQRLDGTDKLLWLIRPAGNHPPHFRFGPYPYRGSAAQYFNLVWPIVIGFAWSLQQQSRRRGRKNKLGSEPTFLLLPAALVMASVPIVAASRAGAGLTLAMCGGFALFTALQRNLDLRFRITVAVVLLGAMGLGLWLGGDLLQKRFESVLTDQMGGREQTYATGRRMLAEFDWRGAGADTFSSLSFLFRPDIKSGYWDPGYWAAYLHDDWTETLVTLGWPGLALLVALLIGVTIHWRAHSGPTVPSAFPVAAGLGLLSLLVHAKVDFPFQIGSLQFTFLLLCAVLTATPSQPR